MLPLRPVAAAAEDVQARVLQPGQQAQAGVERHEAVVAAPDHERGLGDLAQAVADIGKLLRVGLGALDKVLQVIAARQHVGKARLEQLLCQHARVVHKHVHHAFEVFGRGCAVKRPDELDALGGHRHQGARAAGAPAHEHQLGHTPGVGQRKGHCAVRAHRIADDMRLVQTDGVHEPFKRACIEFGARAGADHRVALAPARAVHQDHAVACCDQRLEVAVEVCPAAGAGARTVQHDHGLLLGLGPGSGVVVMQLQVEVALLDANEAAGGGFGDGAVGGRHEVAFNALERERGSSGLARVRLLQKH